MIKASLKAARQEQTPENQSKVETNITIALSLKGDPNVREEEEGETALFWAIRERRSNVVALLLELGADVSVKDTTGETPLHEAANSDANTARKLLERGADVNAASKDGTTPLIAAVKVGNNEVAELLLIVEGVKPNLADEEGWTALHYAAQRGDLDCVRSLIEKKVDVNARSKEGETPLKLASAKGHSDVEAALTAAGAQP
jgi:ankyrin repeat protein